MNIEFLSSGSPECPVIRFCEFSPEEAADLRKLFHQLATGGTSEIALHEVASFRALDNLQLTLRVSAKDLGIRRLSNQLRGFELRLRPETYADLADLTAAFECDEASRAFQWLDERGDVKLLLSPSGWW